MGAGVALEATKRFPGIAKVFGGGIKDLDMVDYNVFPATINGQTLVALQTKRNWRDPSPLDLIVSSCKELLNWVNHVAALNPGNEVEKVYMSRPGCGNGGLKWADVKAAISFLDDRFIICNKD